MDRSNGFVLNALNGFLNELLQQPGAIRPKNIGTFSPPPGSSSVSPIAKESTKGVLALGEALELPPRVEDAMREQKRAKGALEDALALLKEEETLKREERKHKREFISQMVSEVEAEKAVGR